MIDYKVMINDQISSVINDEYHLFHYMQTYYAYDLQTPKWYKSQISHKSQNVNINLVLKF